jgi:4-diphosphocytidyl-2-C-methyl-D-erythritol kinase
VTEAVSRIAEPAPAKINLALHVRGRLPDGRHRIETLFAFCVDGDRIEAEPSSALSLECGGRFGEAIEGENLVLAAARALQDAAGVTVGAGLRLTKNLPVASGIGGGSADAAAALRLLTRLWDIDPQHASSVAPGLGADVPACLLSMTSRGIGAGDALELIDAGVSGSPILLVNPMIALSTGAVFAAWDGQDRGTLAEWREGRNDLEAPARSIVPEIGDVLDWLGQQHGAAFERMSGSGATCFALFEDEAARDAAAALCPEAWWHLTTHLR